MGKTVLKIGFMGGFVAALVMAVPAPSLAVLQSGGNQGLYQTVGNLDASLVQILAIDVPGEPINNGHGVVVDPSGIIATSTHIIYGKQHIIVRLADGQQYPAQVLYVSSADFSFIKIDAPTRLKAIAWGNCDYLEAGNKIVAVANSGLNQEKILDGEVLSKIKAPIANGVVSLLELKVPLKPGDSGGPILDQQGCLLGIIMAHRLSDNTKSLAIASNQIQEEFLKFKGSTVVASNRPF